MSYTEKIIGEDTEYAPSNKKSARLVSYWNLIRSYLLLNHKDDNAIFYAKGIGDNMDFLHYAKCISFNTEEEMNSYYQDEFANNDDILTIRISNGTILD